MTYEKATVELIQFGTVHVVSGASDAPETDFNWLFFHFFTLIFGSAESGME